MADAFKSFSPLIREFYWIIKPVLLLVIWYFVDLAVNILAGRFNEAAARHAGQKNGAEQRAAVQRAVTIYSLATQIIRGLVATVMIFWALDSVGIDMRPVIAGVGVIGLALSLAAQNIIRDYINGFMILVEDQFNVGDFITAAGFSGTVEFFSFRSTKLRDMNGSLITIPNSAIQVVKNSSKNWSAAIIDIGISYESDYKKALEIASEIAHKMASDITNNIIEQPSTHGIITFTDSAVMLRTILKTYPGLQWAVGRDFRQKLKDAYDKRGIVFARPWLSVQNCAPAITEKEGNSEIK